MTSFCSPLFLGVFLPGAVAAYAIAPRKARPCLLLALSYLCFWLISRSLLSVLLVATAATYLAGRALGAVIAWRDRESARVRGDRAARKAVRRRAERRMRWVLAAASLVVVGLLVAFKYLGFFGSVASGLVGLLGVDWRIAPLAIGVPIGISFYTLQALSYLFDVYRGSIEPERDPVKLALFLAFFPQIMEGPICRYGETADSLAEGRLASAGEAVSGVLRIVWGCTKVVIVADRLNLFVKPVFDQPGNWGGAVVALGAVLYTLQLYCDFSGTMDIVVGAARIFGVRMPENFRQPFFSRTASEFWQRWHVSLGSWLRDYVFYPVSFSRPVKRFAKVAKRSVGVRAGSALSAGVALGCVWFLNGLWHGAGWQYLFFGFYYFVIILSASLFEPLFQRIREAVRVDVRSWPWRAFQIVRTWAVVVVGELFFRAPGLHAGLTLFSSLFTGFSVNQLWDGSLLKPGMGVLDFWVVGVFVAALFVVGVCRERGVPVLPASGDGAGGVLLRASVAGALLVAVLVFGAYGTGYIPLDPIYAQF